MKTIVLTIVLSALMVGLAIIAMGVKALFVKGGRFPSGHVHDIPALKRKGIGCASGNGGSRGTNSIDIDKQK